MRDSAAPVLALDTSGEHAAAALDFGSPERAAAVATTSARRGEDLAGVVSALLERERVTARELAALAVVTGPGSYTGLRIGLALVRGLALVDRTPVVGVGTLELAALAMEQAGSQRAVVLPAATERAYFAVYHCEGLHLRVLDEPEIVGHDDLAARLSSLEQACSIGTERASRAPQLWRLLEAQANGAWPRPIVLAPVRAGLLARVGRQRLAAGQADEAARVMPAYIGPGNARRNRNRVALDPSKLSK